MIKIEDMFCNKLKVGVDVHECFFLNESVTQLHSWVFGLSATRPDIVMDTVVLETGG